MPQDTNLIVVVRTVVINAAVAQVRYTEIKNALDGIADLAFSANVTEQLDTALSPTPP